MIKRLKKTFISKYFLIAGVFLLLLSVVSCSKWKKQKRIPEKIFSEILYEIHLGNGLLIVPDVRNIFIEQDTLRNYLDIIEKYGHSIEQMDNTLRYYFLKKPKKLIEIYDRNIGRMTEIESLLLKSQQTVTEFTNLWPERTELYLPDTTGNRKLHFTHVFQSPGSYYLKFSATVYPNDPSFNPQFIALTSHADSLATGKQEYISNIKYFKDGLPHTYSLRIIVKDKYPLALSIYFFDHNNKPDIGFPHARISNIILHSTR